MVWSGEDSTLKVLWRTPLVEGLIDSPSNAAVIPSEEVPSAMAWSGVLFDGDSGDSGEVMVRFIRFKLSGSRFDC